jgi:signal transduction histidine kinase
MKSFRMKAMAGGALATVLLAAGMLFSIRGFDVIATAQMTHIRAEEREITLAERLRWGGELIVSTGRGYLISNDPTMLAKLLHARVEFDNRLLALRAVSLTSGSESLAIQVERSARNFIRMQKKLVAARNSAEAIQGLAVRFERELIPLQRELSRSLDRLVKHKEAVLADIYAQVGKEMDRLATWMYGLLAMLIVLGSTITSYFARQTGRAYTKEQHALEIARRAVTARDDMMGIVAHDLRNPLNSIALKAALLKRLSKSAVEREQAESIMSTTTGMEHLIKSMLDVASMEAGRFSVMATRCNVDDIVHKSMEIFGVVAIAKGIQLLPAVRQAGLTVRADRERVLQVLSNLLGNALKFAPEGSQVILSVEQQEETVRFAVSDVGPGIQAEQLPHVFDRFWKRETEAKKGTGLGLFIAKGIVVAHGGQIWVESEPGCGATFSFTLPIFEKP